MIESVEFRNDANGVDWRALKDDLAKDKFDNGRTPDQLERSFANSAHSVFAYLDERVIGTARILSDGICNAYLVDVWTLSRFRRQGIGRRMVQQLLSYVPGQHVGLFTDEFPAFYKTLGFADEPGGMSRVVGQWLESTRDS